MYCCIGNVISTNCALMQTLKHLETYVTRIQVQQGMMDNLSLAYELETLRSEDRKQKLQRQIMGN